MASWPYESKSTQTRKPPQSDGLCIGTIRSLNLVERNGLLLGTTASVPIPLQSMYELGSIPYLRKLAGHRIRVSREEKRLREMRYKEKGVKVAEQPRKNDRGYRAKGSLPFGINPNDLKIVDCAQCGSTLLAECLEYLRDQAIEFKLKTVSNFPPPVCARLFGSRPYCIKCVDTLLARGQIGRKQIPARS